MKLPVLAALGAAAVICAQTLERSGGEWLASATHALPDAVGELRVRHVGPMRISSGPSASITIRKRVKAGAEGEARRQFRAAGVGWRQAGPVTTVEAFGAGQAVWVELDIVVPAGVRHVHADTRWGSVAVLGVSGDVAVSTGGGHVVVDGIGGNVSAETRGGPIRVGSAGGSVRAVTGSGPVAVRHAGGGVDAESGGGEIVIEFAAGAVRAATGAGNVEVKRALGSVQAHTRGGLIQIREAGGEVVAGNDGGATRVTASGAVRCESAAGSIRAEFVSPRVASDSILRTGSGDITVWLPSNVAVTVEAGPESGRLISEFGEFRRSGEVLVGVLNGGGPVLRLESAGGTIYLRRR